ncbi:hypothetical protein LROSL1_2059 [Furfurilactobacillus rossiae]|uniref:DUF2785 domain-containing protein n=1 Tax=Furfurilactobacillus rossiae TaxID=231049 RepID=UPI0015BD5AA9|nr:DUF2785 domain-containing protein [Furfurilactobacillus rossiae]MCF6164577.1 DUF2785 domain-containing protein [Furfurilactobacillus rossiae]QLE64860.1 hypothetical protein LROSL1_2059 [Furfurilactobacillus rossiae]
MTDEKLERKLTRLRKENPPTVNDSLLAAMLDNIGNLNSVLRDQLIYSSFAQWIDDGTISNERAVWLLRQVQQRNLLFSGIHERQNDAIYTRTFAALLLTSLVARDARAPFLTANMRTHLFEDATQYLQLEKDLRGLTEHGWAHAFGHDGDLLYYVCYHPKFPTRLIPQALAGISHGIMLPNGFTAGEGSRLDNCLVALLAQDRITESQLLNWLRGVRGVIALTADQSLQFDQKNKLINLCVSLAYKLRFESLTTPRLSAWLDEQIRDFYEANGTVA